MKSNNIPTPRTNGKATGKTLEVDEDTENSRESIIPANKIYNP